MSWLAFLIGLAAGVASGLVGIGGGIIMVPAMVLLLATDQHLAAGTSLAAIVMIALAGSYVHLRHGHMQVRSALVMGLFGAVGAQLGARWALAIDGDQLSRAFGIFLVVMGLRLVLVVWRAGRSRKAGEPTPTE